MSPATAHGLYWLCDKCGIGFSADAPSQARHKGPVDVKVRLSNLPRLESLQPSKAAFFPAPFPSFPPIRGLRPLLSAQSRPRVECEKNGEGKNTSPGFFPAIAVCLHRGCVARPRNSPAVLIPRFRPVLRRNCYFTFFSPPYDCWPTTSSPRQHTNSSQTLSKDTTQNTKCPIIHTI